MSEKSNEIDKKTIIDAYLEFFKNTDAETKLTNEFQAEYRQKEGGYIDLAAEFEFYNFLKNQKDIEELTGLKMYDILHPTETPNQKWHLMISYLYYIIFELKTNEDRGMNITCLFCPELCLWMLEASGKFKNDELEKVREHAIHYKNKEDFEGRKYSSTERGVATNEWKSFIKPYMEQLHEKVLNNIKNKNENI